MNNNGKEIYPYTEGERGIPFEELLTRAGKGEHEGTFISGSGQQLKYLISEREVFIYDPSAEIDNFSLRVLVGSGGLATFDLRTRKSSPATDQNIRHPDMFAKEFVGFALSYFGKAGTKIFACKGVWHPLSDNYKAYMEEFEKTHDQMEAIKATWSAKTFALYGYTQIKPLKVSQNEIRVAFCNPDTR